jgi:starch synthase
VIYTAQEDQFTGKLADSFIQKAMISGDLKEKDMELFKEGTATALTLGGSKCADVVIQGSPEWPDRVQEEVKPSRTKKVIKWDESWKEDVTPLLELYKSLTAS